MKVGFTGLNNYQLPEWWPFNVIWAGEESIAALNDWTVSTILEPLDGSGLLREL